MLVERKNGLNISSLNETMKKNLLYLINKLKLGKINGNLATANAAAFDYRVRYLIGAKDSPSN